MSRASNLVDDIEQQLENRVESVKVLGDEEVYVSVDGVSDDLHGMDSVCVIAYDHGFVPSGIIDTGASRFKPRDADEHTV